MIGHPCGLDTGRSRPVSSRHDRLNYRIDGICKIIDAATQQPDPERYASVARDCACFNLRKASRAVTQLFDDLLEPTGLRSTQFVILVAIAVYGPSSVARLAREMVMDPSTMARNLRPLETAGLVERTRSRGVRGRHVLLTETGRRALESAMPFWESAQDQFIDRFGRDTWATLAPLLGRAVTATRS